MSVRFFKGYGYKTGQDLYLSPFFNYIRYHNPAFFAGVLRS